MKMKDESKVSEIQKWDEYYKGKNKYNKDKKNPTWYRTLNGKTYNMYHSNICLNPDNEKEDWCYNTDGSWNYCKNSRYTAFSKASWDRTWDSIISWFD